MSKLFYVPLEGYKERYTLQWSAPRTGWLERNWIKHQVHYERIEGDQIAPRQIKSGCVLDAVGRSTWCFDQIKKLLHYAENGMLTSEDVILFDDFWTPGLEALPYAFHLLMGARQPKMYAFLHAQSIDEYDFTHPMRDWMRPIEKGFGRFLDGIFVCCPTLRDLVVGAEIAPKHKVEITGHPFSSEEVWERMCKAGGFQYPRRNNVVWSSRWDHEKNPGFFLQVAQQVIKTRPDITFTICTGAKNIRSNNVLLVPHLKNCCETFPQNIFLKENLTKEEYYKELLESKIQFNCASQDFVAITLLEASVAGCYPIYPAFRSFPETFLYDRFYMYEHLNCDAAVAKIINVMNYDNTTWETESILNRAWIHERFDSAWLRMLWKMKIPASGVSQELIEAAGKDPFRLTGHQ